MRVAPRPQLAVAAGDLFAESLSPHVSHAAVRALGEATRSELLRRALVRYLHGTSVLEIRVVNPVLAELAHGHGPWDLPTRVRVEALAITCDEAFHALGASDLLEQLGCDEADEPEPAFLGRLRSVTACVTSSEDRAILQFLFTVVTETAISANLRCLARAPSLDPGVRAFVADHARDEARHAAFFSALFSEVWSRLAQAERTRFAPRLPQLVHAFLAPSLGEIHADLAAVGVDAGAADEVLAETYPEAAVRASVAAGARPVLACFRRAGALARPYGESFSDAGLGPAGA